MCGWCLRGGSFEVILYSRGGHNADEDVDDRRGNSEASEWNGVDYGGADDGSRNHGNKVSPHLNDRAGLKQDEGNGVSWHGGKQ